MFDIEISPRINEITKRLSHLGAELKTKGMRTAMVAYARPLKKAIKSRVGSRTGALGKSIGQRSMSKREKSSLGFGKDKVLIAVGSTRKVYDISRFKNLRHHHKLHWLDEGVKSHEIEPKKKGGMLKIGRSGFARKISHPGVAPKRILDRSLRSSHAASIQSFDRAITRFLGGQK